MQCKCSTTSYVLAARCATLVALVTALQFSSWIPSKAHAQQFVLVDQTYTADNSNTQDSHFTADLKSGIPTNLRAPVNYANGSVHVDLEMIETPSSTATKYNICLENSSDVACLPYVDYKGKGKYKADPKFMAFWQNDKVDWTKGVTKVSLILKDANEQKVQGNAMFYPYKAHVTLTVVAEGSTFDPDKTDSGAAGGSAMMGQGGRAGGSSMSQGGKSGLGKAGSSASSSANGGTGGMSSIGKGGSGGAGSGGAAANGGAATATASGATSKPAQAPISPSAAGSSSPTTARSVRGAAGSDEGQTISSQLENTGGCSVGHAGSRAMSAWPLIAIGLFAARTRKRRGAA